MGLLLLFFCTILLSNQQAGSPPRSRHLPGILIELFWLKSASTSGCWRQAAPLSVAVKPPPADLISVAGRCFKSGPFFQLKAPPPSPPPCLCLPFPPRWGAAGRSASIGPHSGGSSSWFVTHAASSSGSHSHCCVLGHRRRSDSAFYFHVDVSLN